MTSASHANDPGDHWTEALWRVSKPRAKDKAMNPWIAILLIAGTTGLVAYLTTRRRGPTITDITRTTRSDDPE